MVASLNSFETCNECITNKGNIWLSCRDANLSRLLDGIHAGDRTAAAIA